MKTSKWMATIAAVGLVAVSGCRVDPGETDYASQQISDFQEEEVDMGQVEFLPGPDPYVPGEPRLTFGPFYEGAESDEIPIDDTRNFFFVFDAEGRSSLEITTSTDRIEGFQSNVFRHEGTSFWGMSLNWFDGNPDDGASPRPEDMSDWTTMYISFKSSDPAFENVQIGLGSSAGEGVVSATDYGYTNDGEWHTVAIPLDDFGTDLMSVHTPLILSGMSGSDTDELLVDNFYWTAE